MAVIQIQGQCSSYFVVMECLGIHPNRQHRRMGRTMRVQPYHTSNPQLLHRGRTNWRRGHSNPPPFAENVEAWRRHGGILHYGPVGLPPWGSTMLSSDGDTLSHGSVQSRGALRRVESRNRPTHSKSGEPSSGSSGEMPALLVRRRRRRSLWIGASYLKRSALQSPTKSRPPSQASTSRLRGRCRLFI